MEKIRIIIGMLGLDQHEVGAIAVARMLRDAGMEVIYLGKFNTPPGIVKACLEEGPHVIGLSCHSWEYLHYLPELLKRLAEDELDVPVVVGGSVITPSDAEALAEMGAAASFGPGATKAEIVETIEQLAARQP